MTRTTCPTCQRPLTSVDISANLLNEVTVTYSCGKHERSDTWAVPTRQTPVVPVQPPHVVGANFVARPRFGDRRRVVQ